MMMVYTNLIIVIGLIVLVFVLYTVFVQQSIEDTVKELLKQGHIKEIRIEVERKG
ncbi:hypothetical protein [Bacillus sp. BP-3]|uniref:hypothetical protein n=1 Tax=Bacillus sp. BP-3 TaxID=3022773 RepID=UPI00232E862D|nr:hypothetical protein [Bacillus sp. BP-3]MDC2867345.1 hypothetical protein [Bacillus sp. BP-3]